MTVYELELVEHLRDEWCPTRHVASFSAKTLPLSFPCKTTIISLGMEMEMDVSFPVEEIERGDTTVEQHFVRASRWRTKKQ